MGLSFEPPGLSTGTGKWSIRNLNTAPRKHQWSAAYNTAKISAVVLRRRKVDAAFIFTLDLT